MITGRTAVYALIGTPLDASPSPRLHNRWFRALGIDGVYVALPTRSDAAPAAIRSLGLAGANVTTPLKRKAAHAADRLESAAARAGAANTLWWDGGELVGANTDGEGFVRALPERVSLPGARVVIVGAGGAARGIADACMAHGVAHLTVLNRTVARAETLVRELAQHWPQMTAYAHSLLHKDALASADMVAVTVPADLPLDPALTPEHCAWVDIGTGPLPNTAQRARAMGRPTINGMGMLVWQAALAFERWTGQVPPVASTDFAQS